MTPILVDSAILVPLARTLSAFTSLDGFDITFRTAPVIAEGTATCDGMLAICGPIPDGTQQITLTIDGKEFPCLSLQ